MVRTTDMCELIMDRRGTMLTTACVTAITPVVITAANPVTTDRRLQDDHMRVDRLYLSILTRTKMGRLARKSCCYSFPNWMRTAMGMSRRPKSPITSKGCMRSTVPLAMPLRPMDQNHRQHRLEVHPARVHRGHRVVPVLRKKNPWNGKAKKVYLRKPSRWQRRP